MSDQEINQNNIMEQIFKKFDTDGSGALDLGELVDLFRQNKIFLDEDTVKLMFNGDCFSLEKFKSMIDNDVELSQFRSILLKHRDNILMRNEQQNKINIDEMSQNSFKIENIILDNNTNTVCSTKN